MFPVGKRHAKTCALFTLLWSKGKVVKMRETGRPDGPHLGESG